MYMKITAKLPKLDLSTRKLKDVHHAGALGTRMKKLLDEMEKEEDIKESDEEEVGEFVDEEQKKVNKSRRL